MVHEYFDIDNNKKKFELLTPPPDIYPKQAL